MNEVILVNNEVILVTTRQKLTRSKINIDAAIPPIKTVDRHSPRRRRWPPGHPQQPAENQQVMENVFACRSRVDHHP